MNTIKHILKQTDQNPTSGQENALQPRVTKAELYDQISSMIKQHLSAVDINRCGYGYDPYFKDSAQDHSMAYGLYATAFTKLFRATRDNEYLDDAILCLSKLGELSSKSGYMCWGLPFPWQGLPAFHPYTITTVMVGESILEIYRITRKKSHRDVLHSLCSWLIEELEWTSVDKKIACPQYAPGLPTLANNVASKAGALLFKAGNALWAYRFRFWGEKALRYVRMQQTAEGYWVYGRADDNSSQADKIVDSTHFAYTLEGVVNYYRALPGMIRRHLKLHESIDEGLRFYTAYLLQKGRVLEKCEVMGQEQIEEMHARSIRSRNWRIESLDEDRSLVFFPGEVRLWGYGAALEVLAKAYKMNWDTLRSWTEVFQYIRAHLVNKDRHFKYKSNDANIYVRHEAHVFNGLTSMLLALSEEKS